MKKQKDNGMGRDIFEEYCNKTTWCKFKRASSYEYATWDVAYLSGNTQIIGEIKIREYDSKAFSGWFLEDKKLKALNTVRDQVIDKQQLYTNTKPVIHYINIFNDGVILIWDITELNEITVTYQLNGETIGNTTNKAKDIITLETKNTVIHENYSK